MEKPGETAKNIKNSGNKNQHHPVSKVFLTIPDPTANKAHKNKPHCLPQNTHPFTICKQTMQPPFHYCSRQLSRWQPLINPEQEQQWERISGNKTRRIHKLAANKGVIQIIQGKTFALGKFNCFSRFVSIKALKVIVLFPSSIFFSSPSLKPCPNMQKTLYYLQDSEGPIAFIGCYIMKSRWNPFSVQCSQLNFFLLSFYNLNYFIRFVSVEKED